jgi:hypothetical protein
MSGRRSTRRSTTQKAVDYAREQEFSDANDVFEDSEEEPAPKRKSKPRKSTSSRANAASTTIDTVGDLDDEGGYQPSKPIYTEKGYDPNMLPIRERFPFLPEFEPDGSPRIDLIVGRRPIDEKGDSKSNENLNDDGSQDGSEDEEDGGDDSEEDGGRRKSRKRGGDKKKNKKDDSSPSKKNESSDGPVEYEYLVKYKNRSYLHLEWKTGADLESMNKSAKTLYRRYLKKLALGLDDELEDPNFDPSYAEPQKIVDEAEQEIVMELSDKELLKWEKEREKTLADEDEGSDSEMEIEGIENGKDKKAEEEKKTDSEAAPEKTSEEKKGKKTCVLFAHLMFEIQLSSRLSS